MLGRRKDHVAAGLTYAVHFSADLGMWTTSVTAPTVLTKANSAGDIEAVSISSRARSLSWAEVPPALPEYFGRKRQASTYPEPTGA